MGKEDPILPFNTKKKSIFFYTSNPMSSITQLQDILEAAQKREARVVSGKQLIQRCCSYRRFYLPKVHHVEKNLL